MPVLDVKYDGDSVRKLPTSPCPPKIFKRKSVHTKSDDRDGNLIQSSFASRSTDLDITAVHISRQELIDDEWGRAFVKLHLSEL